MCNKVYECGRNGGYCPFTTFIELNNTILIRTHPVPKHLFRVKYVYQYTPHINEI